MHSVYYILQHLFENVSKKSFCALIFSFSRFREVGVDRTKSVNQSAKCEPEYFRSLYIYNNRLLCIDFNKRK